jgi:hypothetical protein
LRVVDADDFFVWESVSTASQINLYNTNMDSILGLVQALPATDSWGPTVTTDTLRDGLPYAPFSKGDKLGRMADWTAEGKDREGRGGRQQYGRNFRGEEEEEVKDLGSTGTTRLTSHQQTNPTAPAQDSKPHSTSKVSAKKPVSPLSTTRALLLVALSAVAVVPSSVDVAVLVVVLLSVVVVVALSSALEVADLDNSSNMTTVVMHSVEAVVAVEEAGRTGTSRNALVRLRSSLAIPGSCLRRSISTVSSS